MRRECRAKQLTKSLDEGEVEEEVEATGEGLQGHLEIQTLGIVEGALMGALSKDFSKEVGKFSKQKIY